MPALHEGSRLTGPKRQLRELATRDCYMGVLAICGAKVNIKNETANTKAPFFSKFILGLLAFLFFFITFAARKHCPGSAAGVSERRCGRKVRAAQGAPLLKVEAVGDSW